MLDQTAVLGGAPLIRSSCPPRPHPSSDQTAVPGSPDQAAVLGVDLLIQSSRPPRPHPSSDQAAVLGGASFIRSILNPRICPLIQSSRHLRRRSPFGTIYSPQVVIASKPTQILHFFRKEAESILAE